MANTVIINRVIRRPDQIPPTEDYLHSGVNQQSRLVKIAVDSSGSLAIPHTLSFHPKWVEMAECLGYDKFGIPAPATTWGKDGVWLHCQERDVADAAVAPDVGGVGNIQALTFAMGGNPQLGTGTVYVYCLAPAQQGNTEYYYFTFHVGRTHSSPK